MAKVTTSVKASSKAPKAKGGEKTISPAQLRMLRVMSKGKQGTAYTRKQLKAATGRHKGYSAMLRGNAKHYGLEQAGYITVNASDEGGREYWHILTTAGRKYVEAHSSDVLTLHTVGDSGKPEASGLTITPIEGSSKVAPKAKGKANKGGKVATPKKAKSATKVKAVEPVTA